MVKNIAEMDIIFNELNELYAQLQCKHEFTLDENSSKLKPLTILDDNSDKELLEKIHSVFEKCYKIPLDSYIEDASEYISMLDDLLKLNKYSIEYTEEIQSAKLEKKRWNNHLSNLKEYKKTYQEVEGLIPQIQKLLSPAYTVQSSVQVINQNIQQNNNFSTDVQNTNKQLVSLPNIGVLIKDMAIKKNNTRSDRAKSLLKSMLEEVGISLEDDYSKMYDADIITLLGKNIYNLDVKGSVKLEHKRYLTEFIEYVSSRSNQYYTKNFIELIPNFHKTKKHETDPHKPYKTEELIKIFDPEYNFFKDNPDVFFACLVGLYTGSRTRAATTLQFKDIIQVDGVMCIDINLNHKIKRTKTDITIRKVPIHSDLINLGFLDYIERRKKERKATDEDFIFPDCMTKNKNYNAHFMEDTFFEFLKELGIKKEINREQEVNTVQEVNTEQLDSNNKNGKKRRKKSTSDGHDFHSFRKNINLALIKEKVDVTYINQICGWEGGNVREIHYSEHELLDIQQEVEKLHYDFLKPAFAEWKKIMAER